MAINNKLLLIRTGKMRAQRLSDAGLDKFLKGEALPVSPKAWADEAGLSHYAFELGGFKLKDWAHLEHWVSQNGDVTLLDMPPKFTKEQALASVGLRVNESALEEEPTPEPLEPVE